VLLSYHFFYFGSKAVPLPSEFQRICHQQSGHKSSQNDSCFQNFVEWIENSEYKTGQLYGWPDYIVDWDDLSGSCSVCLTRLNIEEEE